VGETLVGSLEQERRTRVFEGTPTGLPFTAAPPGFRAEDYLGIPELEGFVTVPEAAERMGVTEEEVGALALPTFALAYQVMGRTVYVRPAIIEG
jgi:hypothetical protein